MSYFLEHSKLDALLMFLHDQGYACYGPQVKHGAIIFDKLTSAKHLPWGVQDEQSPGKYRLKSTTMKKAFAFTLGPQAIKPFLFKPKEHLWRVERDTAGKLIFKQATPQAQPVALLGVRSCDLAGMLVQDKTFLESKYQDERYKIYRENLLLISVNCSYSATTCFCVSTNTGPKAEAGFDLALTEVESGFVVESGSTKGEKIIAHLRLQSAAKDQLKKAEENSKHAAAMQTKRMPRNNQRSLRDSLLNNLDHPQWDDVATRCLACGNCTSVCPTCFCHTETETAALDGLSSEHDRQWDSCFSSGHSYVHNKVIREDTKTRYKQWLTHKVGTWWDQFDTSGCIGCGRCITWCPAGIDLTEEIAALTGDTNLVSQQKEEVS